jgi:LacI family transcriptional regulator
MTRVTIADIARHAGTSTAVVSYVLNPGTRPVSDRLRTRVVEAMDELDYRPDRHARALRRRTRWGQIGLLVPDLTFPLYGAIAGCIVREGRTRRQLVITGSTGFDKTAESELVHGFAEVGLDGLIVTGVIDGEATARVCRAARIPLVWMHNSRNIVGLNVVGADHVRAGRLAAEHLVAHGRRNIVFVGGFTEDDTMSGDRDTVYQRYAGYESIVGADARQIATDLTLKGAYRCVRTAIADREHFDALVVGTYGQAAAVLSAITDAGLSIPDDVAVVAFDGDTRNSYAQIVLSTVQQQIDQMARTAVDLIAGDRPESAESMSLFDVFLSPGDSCGCQPVPR